MGFKFWVRFLIIFFALVVLLMLVMKYQKKELRKKKGGSKREKKLNEDVVEEEMYGTGKRSQRKEHFTNDDMYSHANFSKLPEETTSVQKEHRVMNPESCAQVQFQKPYGGDPKMGESGVQPVETMDNEEFKAVDFDPTPRKFTPDCYPKERVSADELLPKDAANSKWAQVNPAGQGELMNQNFLQPEARFGVDTVGQSLRNPNMQLRSDPPIPKIEGVSPWMNSTIDYDSNRRFFEIGSI